MEPLIGKTIDNYQITEVIARGGMGVVFKALDTNLDKVVALKMIDPFLARDANFVKRFKTEAQALAKLQNPHIVIVHALRDTEKGLFMVMEYVESKSLSTILKEKDTISIEETISITEQLLDALAHAHTGGVIHRDIKPGNVLVCDNGKVKVTDFGLAKLVQQRGGSNTMTQTVAGTLYYMSPEQIKGLKNVDIRSDIYSLGITMYEMITGRIPFDKTESDFTVQKAIVDGEIPSPAKFNAGIPRKLVKIITKSIHKDPEKRYQTAGEMLLDIQDFKNEVIVKEVKKKQPLPKKVIYYSVSVFILVIVTYLLFLSQGEVTINYLNVSTFPPNAEIKLENDFIGKSPVKDYQLKNKNNISLHITKEGFISLDTVVNANDSINYFNFSLRPVGITPEVRTTAAVPKTDIPAALTGGLTISSDPPGAQVLINGKESGITPFHSNSLSSGTYKLTLRMKGYRDISESVRYNGKENINVSKKLTPSGNITIKSDPTGAQVSIDGKSAGKTPYSSDQITLGEHLITISKPGYKLHSEKVNLTNDALTITGKLVQLTGKIEILVRPLGSIYIDDQLKVKDSSSPFSSDIPGGKHKIKVVHATLGSYEKEINIIDDKPININVDLSRVLKLTVVSTPMNCEVILNGKPSSLYTPTQLKLAPGNYRIQLKRDGYNPSQEVNYTVPSHIYEDKVDQEDKQIFELTKTN
jgi:eukaryotic-like serine/threonine-protein kinase